jgi:fibronectin type 3 domain-containing protein
LQRDAGATAEFAGNILNTSTNQMPKSSASVDATGNQCRSATTPTPPAQPTGLFAATTSALVGLDWNNNGESDLNTYAVYRSTTSGSNYVQLATRLKTSDYSDTNAVAGVTYYYRVTAVDTCSAESSMSDEVAKWVQPPPTPVPTNITCTVSGGALVLEWPNGVGWQLQAQTNGLSVGLDPASNAWFTVTGTSPYTNTISSTIPAVFFRLRWPAN